MRGWEPSDNDCGAPYTENDDGSCGCNSCRRISKRKQREEYLADMCGPEDFDNDMGWI